MPSLGQASRPERAFSVGVVLIALAVLAACGDSPSQPTPQPLVLACSADVETTAEDAVSTTVTFNGPTATGGTAPVTSVCNPASGASFPVGETVVRCSATDAGQQSATCQFRVRVDSPPRLGVDRIIAFGDSITWGSLGRSRPFSILGPDHSYPAQLQDLLSERYTADRITIFNEGVPGETTPEGVVRLPGVLTTDKGDVLLLLEGVNGVKSASTSSQVANLRTMVRTARSRKLTVLIATLTPISDARERAHPGTRAAIVALNAAIVSMARSERINPVVDLYGAMEGQDELLGPDGLHPNAAGYAMMAELFAEEVQRRFETSSMRPANGASVTR